MEKIKILHIIPQLAVGGAERMVFEYAKVMNGRQLEVRVASCVESGELLKLLEENEIGIFAGSRKMMGGRLTVAKELKKFVLAYQPKIIHTHLLGADLFGFWFKRMFKDNVVWVSTQHNVEFNTSWFRRCIWKWILKKADRVIAVSENVSDYCEREFKIERDKLIVIRNGIDLRSWLVVREREYVAGDILQIATIGRLEKQKGHIYLVKALAKLKDRSWHWHVYGVGSLADELKETARRLGIEKKITWHGVNLNLLEEYANIDVVIQPSLWEGLSLVVMEAMAAARVVIGTPWSVEKMVKDRENGLVVSSSDADGLVQEIVYCLDNPRLLSEIARRARQYAKENCGLDINISKLAEVYQNYL